MSISMDSNGAGTALSRRKFCQVAGTIGLGAPFVPLNALAEERPPACEGKGPYDALVLSCIDPRIIDQVHYYMNSVQQLRCRYGQFAIAGAAVGVMAPKFKSWHLAFWENLEASIALHKIKKVIAIDHRDCGAAKLAYGETSIVDAATETATHKRVLAEFQKEVNRLHPNLEVTTGLMALDGKIEIFSGNATKS